MDLLTDHNAAANALPKKSFKKPACCDWGPRTSPHVQREIS